MMTAAARPCQRYNSVSPEACLSSCSFMDSTETAPALWCSMHDPVNNRLTRQRVVQQSVKIRVNMQVTGIAMTEDRTPCFPSARSGQTVPIVVLARRLLRRLSTGLGRQ